jgi:hypothetical protein
MTTAHTLEELLSYLKDDHKYYFASDELVQLGLIPILENSLYGPPVWGPAYPELTPGSQDDTEERWYPGPDPGPDPDPAHDPLDMIKIEPPSEAEQELAAVSEWLDQASEELDKPTTGQSSWKVEHHSQRAQAMALLAQAQASYAIALQLRRLTDLLEEGLPEISQRIDEIPDALEFVANRIPS